MPTRATYDIINTVEKLRPCGQAVKTEPSQGSIPGSIPGKVTKQVKGEPVSIRRRIRLYHILIKYTTVQFKFILYSNMLLQFI